MEWGVELTNANTGKSKWYDADYLVDFDDIKNDLGLDIDDPSLVLTDWDNDSFKQWKPTTFDIEETLEELDLITDLVDELGEEIFEFQSTYGTDWDEIKRYWEGQSTGFDEDNFDDYMKELYEDHIPHRSKVRGYIDWEEMASDEIDTGDYTVIGGKVFRDDY